MEQTKTLNLYKIIRNRENVILLITKFLIIGESPKVLDSKIGESSIIELPKDYWSLR